MKIVFISNYLNHHQVPFCEAMYKRFGDNFSFVSTSQMREERRKLGYVEETAPSYAKYSYISPEACMECQRLINEADAVLTGTAPESLLQYRKKEKQLIIRYSERLLKRGNNLFKYIPRLIRFNARMRGINQFLLCSSAYAYSDYQKFGLFKNKAYKWGYFPEIAQYDLPAVIAAKNKKKILWCGRFLDWKHPDDAVYAAKSLLDTGYDFELDMIGSGAMEAQLKDLISTLGLEHVVHMLGSMNPNQVRQHMESAGIYLVTSDFNEGWGAVLNESMNSGCAVVASHAVGAAPYLIHNGENGLIYQSGSREALSRSLKLLLDNPSEQDRLGECAYHTIENLWNADIAAERFLKFVEEILAHGTCDLYDEGPCSRAERIKNNWFDHVEK